MNKTEQRAYRWLFKKGYSGVVFRGRITPDFATDSGELFEVKMARNKTIWLGGGQSSALQGLNDVKILVYDGNEGSDEPDEIIPFDDIKHGESIWRNYRIRGNYDNETVNIRVTPSMKEELTKKAGEKCLPLSAFCRMVLAELLKKEG